MAHFCKICGQYEANTDWNDEYTKMLDGHQMCFTCNHWRQQLEWDKERGEHNWAIVNGHHYVLEPKAPKESPFKGFGGAKTLVKFFDGTVIECENLWHQGEIHNPYWRELMPDNATIEWIETEYPLWEQNLEAEIQGLNDR